MIGDNTPVVLEDPFMKGRCFNVTDPRHATKHGYRCPVCSSVIDACHDAAYMEEMLIIWDPDSTQPPAGFAIVA